MNSKKSSKNCKNCKQNYVPHAEHSACPHCGIGEGSSQIPVVSITCRHCSKTTFRASANWPCPHCKMTENAHYGIAGAKVCCTTCEQDYSPLTANGAACPHCGASNPVTCKG
jgi:Zn finger protein HypA/HybF involved in hydrogenase expression